MIIIGIVSSIFGIGFLCWLLFTLAVYALPFLAGLTASLAAFDSGSGAIGALVVGCSRREARPWRLDKSPSPTVPTAAQSARQSLSCICAPATIAGYHATLGFAHIGVPSESWRGDSLWSALFSSAPSFIRIAAVSAPRPAGQRQLWRASVPRHLRPCPERVSRRVVVH